MLNNILKILLLFVVFHPSSNTAYCDPIYSRNQLKNLQESLRKQEGIDRINTLLELSEAYTNFQLDTAYIYSKIARHESVQMNYQWGYYKSIYCSALSKVDNTPISKVIPFVKISNNWFELHSFEKDAIYSQLLYAYCIHYYKSSSQAQSLCFENLMRAKKIGDNQLIGMSFWGINKYKPIFIKNNEFENPIDSAMYYANLTNDSLQIGIIKLYNILSINGTKKAFNNAFLELKNAETWDNTSLKHRANSLLGLGFASISNLDSALFYIQSSILNSEKLNNITKKCQSLDIKTYAYKKSDLWSDALKTCKTLIDFSNKFENHSVLLKGERVLSNIYIRLEEYENAIPHILESLKMAQERKDKFAAFFIKHMLGNSYRYTKEYEKAEKIYTELIEWAKENLEGKVREGSIGGLLNDIADLKIEQENYTEAIQYLQQSIDFSGNQFSSYEIIVKSNLAIAYIENKQFQKADSLYQKIKLESGELTKLKSLGYKLLSGRINIMNQNYHQGIAYLNDYLKKDQTNRITKTKKTIYYDLYTGYVGIKNYKKALEAFEIYKTINDSLQLGIAVDNVIKTQADYELSMSEATVANLIKQKELQGLRLEKQNNLLINRKIYIISLSMFALLVFFISYLLFRRYKQKKEIEKNLMKAKRAELELENIQNQQKVEVSEIKNTLFANISHEFRTPLTLIKVPIQNYKNKIPKEDIPIFDNVLKNADNLLNMIDDLLDLARMESGLTEINKGEFDLLHFSLQLKAIFSTIFKEKQIQLVWNHPKSDAHFKADENRLKIVLNNLLKNAFHHTPEGGKIFVSFSVSNPKLNKDLLITVSNSGKPIDKKDFSNIFDRYYRGNEKSYVGNGIGLSICKQIIELHEGTITAHNQQNGLICFKIKLPGKIVLQKSTPKAIVNTSEKKTLAPLNGQSKAHLLVVEDNEQMRHLLASILTTKFNLTFANDGEAGIASALKTQPDLILSDIMMPKKDGYELLKAIKTDIGTSHIPVVLLTAKADKKSELIGLNQDADAYITKPFDPIAIVARIDNLLRQRIALQKLFFQNPFVLSKELKCTSIDAEFIDRARKILEDNFQNGDFSVHDFCTALALNRNSVHNKIKAFTKQNTSHFIKNFRLEKAVKLLHETNRSITDIHYSCGFNSPQTFSKAFKERFNLTASEHREQNRN